MAVISNSCGTKLVLFRYPLWNYIKCIMEFRNNVHIEEVFGADNAWTKYICYKKKMYTRMKQYWYFAHRFVS